MCRSRGSRIAQIMLTPGAGGILYSIYGFGVNHELMPEVLLKGDLAFHCLLPT